ncbi:zinc finger protein 684-like [Stomoxys calcitrans]|uniref:zinc finger protein 684-like n=1 Tax=Stomoxys calcitrans TaxID=35570 RepID=UPI0027E27C77|nr:zinc finger protein 684-like [Stomoxys calcitrans]
MCRESLEEYNVIECTEATNTLETHAEELVLNAESQNNASITNFEVNIISPEDKKQAFDEETSQVVDPLASHTKLELYLSNVIVKNKPGCTLDTAKKEQRITNEMLKCETCSKMLPTQHSLDAHKRRHLGLLGYPCKYENCGRGFNNYLEWIHHDNEHKGIANSFKCDIDNCNEVFKLYGALNHHKRKDHNLVRSSANGKQVELRYACDEEGCTRRFDILSKLQIHKKRHAGIKDFVCPYCGMRKTTKTELNIHINIHTFEKKYSCPICSKIFRCVGSVSTHIHHVHERRRRTKGSKPPASASRYPCSICGRLLANLISLKNHEDTHAAEKAYACGECGKKFSTRMGRYNHMKTHIKGEKPHKCEACEKRFSMKKNLLIHQALHKGTHSLYVCEICGQYFKWPGAFYSHKKKHLNVGTTEVSTDNQMDLDGVVNDEEPLKGICEISADNEVEVDVVQV